MTYSKIKVAITLSGPDELDEFDLQQEFLAFLQERVGKATIYAAAIVEGLVDRDGVPVAVKN